MDKPFKTIAEQMSLLESRGVATDAETASILEREGYYSVVNGYKLPFRDDTASTQVRDDRYRQGTKFSDIYRLFRFDRDLRLAMFRYFAEAEAVFKTTCAYQFSRLHEDKLEAYLDPGSYRGGAYSSRVVDLIDDFKKALHRHPHERGAYKREYIRHYATSHDEVPLWVLTNFLMLGQIFKFYEYLPEGAQNSVAHAIARLHDESYGTQGTKISPRRLRLAYDHIKDFRNICAHDERLYCARVSPVRDIDFAHLLEDLELVLTREENSRMRQEVMNLVYGLMEDIDADTATQVLLDMGVKDIGKTFFV